jgi:heterodisulfide reductase subunit B
MKRYNYFPGCSSSEGTGAAYGLSTQAVGEALDIELIELADWNCCGSTPYGSLDAIGSTCLSARNLALAEKAGGLDVVTPCSSCYITLNKANSYLKEYPQLRSDVDEALAAADLEYSGSVRVRHLAEILSEDVQPDAIRSKVKISLSGLNVAPYYGCQLVRPRLGSDDPECPQSLDRLAESVGAKVVPYPFKTHCCGGSLIIPEEGLALELIRKLLDSAQQNGAHCVVTACPLCQANLDAYQSRVNSKFKTNYSLPVLFFTQLMGVALGLAPRALGLEKNIVSPMKVLTPYLSVETSGGA